MYPFLVLFTVQIFIFCSRKVTCHELSGRWTTQEGHEFVFLQDGKALWLTRFGSQFDTVPFNYHLDCRPEPATIDLNDFQNGPYSGKTLLGIFEWTSDTSFRLRYESGTAEEMRPKEFDNDATMKFFPAK
jgi:uncharacterized protein (TIGR03067 family)